MNVSNMLKFSGEQAEETTIFREKIKVISAP
jgi:hypothetical protein